MSDNEKYPSDGMLSNWIRNRGGHSIQSNMFKASFLAERFDAACKQIIDSERHRAGIGTLGEKTLHAVLKHTFEPDTGKHEVKIGTYFADIANDEGITEIQTRSFNAMRSKLSFFLENHIVTIVYPVAGTKWLVWLDNETGSVTDKRKSPRKGKVYDIFYELYKIKQFLTHPNIRLCIVSLDIVEYRNLDGWSHDRKKGSSRYERIPENLTDVTYVSGPQEYSRLIPPGLSGEFTAKDFQKASGLSLHRSQTALNVLKYVGAVVPVAKQGNAIVYEENITKTVEEK